MLEKHCKKLRAHHDKCLEFSAFIKSILIIWNDFFNQKPFGACRLQCIKLNFCIKVNDINFYAPEDGVNRKAFA